MRWTILFLAAIELLLSSSTLALDKEKAVRSYGHQSWQTETGLPQNTIHSVLQTHDGYIWLATEGGLVRFDGVQFVSYDSQTTSGLKSNNIRSLLEDEEGSLWISTADGLTQLKGVSFKTFTEADGLPSNNIWFCHKDRSGRLWVATDNGLALRQGTRFQIQGGGKNNITAVAEDKAGSLWIGTDAGLYQHEQEIKGAIHALVEDRNGTLWIGTQSGLKTFANGRFTEISGLPDNNVEALVADRSGHIWIGTPNGLAVYTNGKIRVYSAAQDGLPGSRIGAISEDKQGSIWVSTNLGIVRIANGKVESFTAQDGLSGNVVLSFYEDREGNLWLGTESGGLTILRDQKFTTYTVKDGLSDDVVRSIFQDRSGVLWIGTNGGGLNRFDGTGFSKITTENGLSSNIVLALEDDSAGNLLVGTPDGLNRIQGGHISILTSADGLADDFVRSIYKDTDGSVWIGTRRGLSHLKDDQFTSYTKADGLGSDFVGAILRDRSGVLWIGTFHGLSRFAGGKFTNYTRQNGLSHDVITALHQDGAGALWIGTNGGGLNRLKDGKFFSYRSTLGLPDVLYGMLEDSGQNLWISSNKGVFRVSKEQLDDVADGKRKALEVISYGVADGMKISECSSGGHPSVCRSRNGALWFSTLKGVSVLDPQRLHLNLLPPKVAIELVSVDDQIFDPSQATDVASGHSRFSFQYAGLSFVAPQKVRFKYKLEGFDREWIDAGARRIAYYTNIPPGRYRFTVRASNNDGIWNESGATFAFRLRPRFYQTYWFYALVVIALGLIGYQVYRWRLRQIESQFQAVLAERNRIGREIHDTLAQGFVGISVHLELVGRFMSTSVDIAKEHLQLARALAQDSLAEARRSIWNLRSQGSSSEDFASRLTQMAHQATASTAIKVQFQVGGVYRPLPQNVEAELLRIGQEAVTNAVRHSSAKHIDIDVKFETKRVQMTIEDDGCGFTGQPNHSGPDGHFGLVGMRERAHQINSQLKVESTLGVGTRVSVETPIN